MNVKGYDEKERFEFGVITSFGYPIENSGQLRNSQHHIEADLECRRTHRRRYHPSRDHARRYSHRSAPG